MKKTFSILLVLMLLLPSAGCLGKPVKHFEVPTDFSFSLTWGCYGISSYDSRTGKLVKTTDATHPEDYIAYHPLTGEELSYVYTLIEKLDVDSYPDDYDPGNGYSTPSMTLMLSVSRGETRKTILSADVALSYKSENKKGQAFLSVCEAISELLTATPEWKALPDYENYYL